MMRRIAGAALPMVLLATAAAAEPVLIDRQANHPNGAVMIVKSIDAGPDTTTVEIVVTTASKEVELNRSRAMILTDNLGAKHLLVPPADNETVEIPANSRLTGQMVFSGRLNPAAQRVSLSTNDGVGGSPDSPYTGMPVFRLDLPLRGGAAPVATGTATPATPTPAVAAVAPPPRTVAVDEQVNHPNGTVLLVRSLETTPDGMVVDLKVTSGDREITLNRSNSMHLVDERGARYQVVAPPDNPNIVIPSLTSIEGKVFFAGRLQPGVGRVTLSINDRGGSTDNRFSTTPEFRIEIPLGS